MADEIEPIPDELGPSVAATERGAEWARMFPNATNLAQRRRRSAEVNNYVDALQREQAAQQRELIQTNKTAQDFYFRQKKLQMDQTLAEAQLEERQQRMTHAEQLLPETIAAKRATTRATLARERAVIHADALKAELAEQEANDTDGFQKSLLDARGKGIKPRTPEWEQTLLDARIKNPAANTAIFDDLWKSTTNSRIAPEDAVKTYQETKAKVPSASVSVSPSGGVTIKDSDKDRSFFADQLKRAKDRRVSIQNSIAQVTGVKGKNAKELFQDVLAQADEDIIEYSTRLKELEGDQNGTPTEPLNAPSSSASTKVRKFNPNTGKIE